MKKRWIRKAPIAIAIAALAITIFSTVTMLLWNSVVVGIFHLAAITFWQAAGLLVLSKILFGGFRGRGGFGGWRMRKQMWHKWQQMSPEQQEEFKSKMGHCGPWRRD